MAIETINIKGFTVFKDIKINFSNGVNVLIGENGTGKTHLLKLLYSFERSRTDGLFIDSTAFINEVNLNFGSDLFLNFIKNSDINCIIDNKQYMFNSEYFSKNLLKNFNVFNPNTVFIPAKETLSMSNIVKINYKYSNELRIDKTLIDIIIKAQQIKPNEIPKLAVKVVTTLEKYIEGKIFIESDNTFWVLKNNGDKIPFLMEAEGLRKLGLLWQLLMNENITENTVVLWDEPEANLNPKIIPDLVKILLELSRNGVQIFIATHDYFLPSFIDVLKEESDKVLFHALYKTEDGVKCETEDSFDMLDNNSINQELITLYKEGVKKVMG